MNTKRSVLSTINPRWSASTIAVAFALIASNAQADEADAIRIFQSMSDYLASQTSIAFDYDSTLDIVTTEDQKLAIASSGQVSLERPDQFHAVRHGGFATVELAYDGKTITALNRDANVYATEAVTGSLGELIDTLRDTYKRPLPAADLLHSNVAEILIPLFTNVKDLGTGVVAGTICDHLAFRTEEADLQVWVAQGDTPYPCRYVITDTSVNGWPEYRIDIRNFRAGSLAQGVDRFQMPTGATKVEINAVPDFDELSGHYSFEGNN